MPPPDPARPRPPEEAAPGGGLSAKSCPKCHHPQAATNLECERCGVIFAKLRRGGPVRPAAPPLGAETEDWPARLRELLFEPSGGEPRLWAVGRGLLLLLLAIWSVRFIPASLQSNRAGESVLHLINLPFHEAGHVFFGFLGRFLGVLGGSLMQLLIPLIVGGAFLYRRNPFGGAVGLWWLGESALDLAPYINDARAGQLELLGGVTGSEVEDYHDWEVLLRQLGWLQHDHTIARLAHGLGAVCMLLALAWGGHLVYRHLRRES
jgi:hypothetical protein